MIMEPAHLTSHNFVNDIILRGVYNVTFAKQVGDVQIMKSAQNAIRIQS